MTAIDTHSLNSTDFDLHGIVGIRLLNATPHDAAAVARQLGPIQAELTREPDITIRFVKRLELSSPMRYLGIDDAGFTDDAFFVLRGKHKSSVRVQIPFEQIGERCEIVCESGLSAVPLLIPILNLTALNKNFLPLHAAAFRYQDKGVLVTGWSKGGKTETLLAFAARGAEYIGDEWVYLSPDGTSMFGIPEPVRVWDWHLQDMPQYLPRLKRQERAKLQGLRVAVRTMDRMINGSSRAAAAKLAKRIRPLLSQQMHVNLPPEDLFTQEVGLSGSSLDKIIFVANHETPDISVEPVEARTVAKQMVFSLLEERLDLLSYYHRFRFAFPDACNEHIEQLEARQRQLLTTILTGKDAHAVYHPYPVSIQLLFDAISPLL